MNRAAEDVTGNRLRERGSDTQQRDPGQDWNPGAAAARTKPLHMGCLSCRLLNSVWDFPYRVAVKLPTMQHPELP